MAETPNHSVSALRAGLLCCCPEYGNGRLYSGYLQVVESRNVCGFALRKHDTGDGPAGFVVLIFGAVTVALAMWVELAYQPPYWVHLMIWAPTSRRLPCDATAGQGDSGRAPLQTQGFGF